MASDYQELVESLGHTPNEDVGHDVVGVWIDNTLLEGVQDELRDLYSLSFDLDQITELMDRFGIDFGYEWDYSVADLIAEELENNNGS